MARPSPVSYTHLSSLNYEIAYYVKSADYSVALDAQQEVNLSLIEHFAAEKIEFAFPTRTLYLFKDCLLYTSRAKTAIRKQGVIFSTGWKMT